MLIDLLTNAHFWRENFIYAITYFQAGGNMIPSEGIRQAVEAWSAHNASN